MSDNTDLPNVPAPAPAPAPVEPEPAQHPTAPADPGAPAPAAPPEKKRAMKAARMSWEDAKKLVQSEEF